LLSKLNMLPVARTGISQMGNELFKVGLKSPKNIRVIIQTDYNCSSTQARDFKYWNTQVRDFICSSTKARDF